MRRKVHPFVLAALAWLLLTVAGRAVTERTPLEQCIYAFVSVLCLTLIPEIFFAWRTHWADKYGDTPPWLFQIVVAIAVIWFELVAQVSLLSYADHMMGLAFVLGGLAPFAYPAIRLSGAARNVSEIDEADRQRIATRRLLIDLICCGGLAIGYASLFLDHTDQTNSDGLIAMPVAVFGLIALVEGAAGVLARPPFPPFHTLRGQVRVVGIAMTGAVVVSTVFLIVVSPANGLPWPMPIAAGLVGIAYGAARLVRKPSRPHVEMKTPT